MPIPATWTSSLTARRASAAQGSWPPARAPRRNTPQLVDLILERTWPQRRVSSYMEEVTCPASRKRSSAFDDFPAARWRPAKPPRTNYAVHAAATGCSPPRWSASNASNPARCCPTASSRATCCPPPLRAAFFSGQIDCYQAAAEWLALSRSDAGLPRRGRPPAGDGQLVRRTRPDQAHHRHVATDPRWALYLPDRDRRAPLLGRLPAMRWPSRLNEEPLLRVEVVSQPTRQRQVLENRHAEAALGRRAGL